MDAAQGRFSLAVPQPLRYYDELPFLEPRLRLVYTQLPPLVMYEEPNVKPRLLGLVHEAKRHRLSYAARVATSKGTEMM